MKIESYETGPIGTNAYIIDEKIIIDPGYGISNYINKEKEYDVWLTHAHFDHIKGIKEIKVKNLYLHPKDYELLKDPEKNLSIYTNEPFTIDIPYKDISNITRFIHTPGHTPGSIIIILENNLFTGDTIFSDSIGRTDFPGSSYEDMEKSLIKVKEFLQKNKNIKNIYPGHMNKTTRELILETNPYLY
ncbi:MBL fold metallo-hydrolase [Oceanotoga sp. DSM 15011]|uniref:Glyoxylase-like metal-dependent hydrolase (Beta-lactamase superfamily II) n=1 Tax=Oceanotoga teriensis TaxID=515440 RepID=A0AA45C8X1_9BACT|nr:MULTISPECIES: MBL fold metallo-hydrolase [Oceanotoga]MDN5342735.1 hydroxyacylglutathione hydrolase [Oceanotoga sp.]MDO7977620.1 MBL fold metallo-hydrolase [Oceanotoga teriensis]PWJ96469.1 glyoxylase-like metal-dependent hydrolase (beta-lactamase superfamily II) [Oceanotoga teriensis]UYP00357.1 MBL fold metallo-hydrolase [Oceanotoga sp. DSM 15011]